VSWGSQSWGNIICDKGGKDGEIHAKAHVRKTVMNEKDPGASWRESNEYANEQNVWATGGVKIMAIPYKEYKALCSPTSALENEC
jgi:hypothetical protein